MLVAITLITLIIASLFAVIVYRWSRPAEEVVLGATFSPVYSDYLGVDWKEAYIAVLDDLEVRHLRIPIYWSQVEKDRGNFDFSDVDWIMDEAKKRDAKITLVTGMKVPRWPECFIPEWAKLNSKQQYEDDVLNLIDISVNRYKNHPALERWQVENEPFFPFGICPDADPKRFYKEIERVREIDPNHPIQRTTSGEQSIWFLHAGGADVLGASLYRIVYTPVIGHWVFPIPPVVYAIQAKFTSPFVDKVIISELQAEPWLPPGADKFSIEEKYQLFSVESLRKHMNFAKRTGADEVFLWGVEWWYHLKQAGDSRLWDEGVEIFSN